MLDSKILGQAAKWVGRLFVVLALAFLAWTARKHWSTLSAWHPTLRTGSLLLICSVLYGIGMMFIAESWHQILCGVAGNRITRVVSWPSFGVTQVAKYLPGNVFHYLGRHMWLKQQGVTHKAAVTAAVWEVALIASTALGCASLILMFRPLAIGPFTARETSLVASSVAALLLLCLLVIHFVRRRVPRLAPVIPGDLSLILSPVALLGFFGMQGFTFWLLFRAVGAEPQIPAAAVAMLAWVVGYATPGAPGGIGSREAILVSLTTPMTGPANALILAALFRVATTLGDFVCFSLSSLVARRAPPDEVEAPAPEKPMLG